MNKKVWYLYFLHVFSDGFEASFLLLLPFIAKDLHINLAQVGVLGTINNAIEIFIAFPSGYFAAKYGGLKTLIIGLFFYCMGFLLTSISPSFFLLFGTFFIAGVGFGSFHSVAFALISRLSTKENRGKTMGNFMAIGDVGRIGISTILTFLIVLFGWRHTALGYSIAGLLLMLILYKPIFSIKEEHDSTKEKEPHIPIKHFLKNKQFVLANITNFFDSFASSSLFIFLPFLLLKRGINPAILGGFTAAYFVGNFFGKTVLGRFVDIHGAAKIFVISEICMALFIFILANVPSFIVIIIASIILGIFTKGTAPINKTMVTEAIEHQGNFERAFGLNGIVSSIAVTLAPLALGFASNNYGIISAFNLSALFAIIATIPAIVLYFEKKNGYQKFTM